MTKALKKIFIVYFLICFAPLVNAQDVYQVIQPVDAVMKAKQYKDGSNEKQIFASLAVNNIRNIHQVSLYVKGDLLVSIRKDEEDNLFAYVKMIRPKISGEVKFRGFLIDSLLLPKAFEGFLYIYNDHQLLAKLPVEMLLTGGVFDLESIQYKIKDPELITAEIEIKRFFLSDRQLQQYMDVANNVNLYYSYGELLQLLIERFEKNRLNRGLSSAETFMAWHELNRVKSYIESHKLEHALHLDKNDPLQFIAKTKQLERLERRASTLFSKELQTGRKGKLSDRDKYCRRYTDLSVKYMELARNYQPNMVAAFNEMLYIYPVEEDLNRMSNVASFYDIFKITGVPATTQRIYNYFVEDAGTELEKEEYLNALALISNARQMELFFTDIEPLPVAEEVYVKSLDGLLSSFLQVSVMAYKARNFKMARRYYRNAQNIYDEHEASLGNEEQVKYSFRRFVEKQVELAGLLLDDASYDEAVALLDDANNILNQHGFSSDTLDLSSKYKKGYSGIYERLVDSVEYYIEQEKKENSLSALISSAGFEQSHSAYLNRDERITSYAYILYENFYSTGVSKLTGRHPEEAIGYLQEAEKINKLFLLRNDHRIDSLISLAALPLIREKIKKAGFEIWANRLDAANKIKEEVVAMQQEYQLGENREINLAIDELDKKIKQRVCVSLQYSINNACRVVSNRVASGKFGEGEKKLKQMYSSIKDHPECDVDTKELDSLDREYAPLFVHVKNRQGLTSSIRTSGFRDVRLKYDSLLADYRKYKLNRFIKKLPPLRDILAETGSGRIIKEAVAYYISEEDFNSAFAFLEILKKRGYDARSLKDYQKKTGAGLCAGKNNKEDFIQKLTKKDPYYRVLRTSCLKN